jgi:hypothetical protein
VKFCKINIYTIGGAISLQNFKFLGGEIKLQNAESTAFSISLVCTQRTVFCNKLSDVFLFLDIKANALLLNDEACFE